MLLLDHGGQHLVERGIHRHRNDVVARHHDFANRNVVEIEHAVDHVFLHFGQMTQAAARADDQFQLLRRVPAAALPLPHAQGARDGRARLFDHPHEWLGDAVEDQQRRRHGRRQPVRFFDGQILRNHFADHHVKVRHHQERQHETDGVQHSSRVTGVMTG